MCSSLIEATVRNICKIRSKGYLRVMGNTQRHHSCDTVYAITGGLGKLRFFIILRVILGIPFITPVIKSRCHFLRAQPRSFVIDTIRKYLETKGQERPVPLVAVVGAVLLEVIIDELAGFITLCCIGGWKKCDCIIGGLAKELPAGLEAAVVAGDLAIILGDDSTCVRFSVGWGPSTERGEGDLKKW